MPFPAYLAGTDPITLFRILRVNGRVDTRRLGRVIVLALASVVLLPFNLLERVLYGRRIAACRLDDDPVVVLGHDRSGTTHLLNLLSLDPQFAWIRPSQMVLPGCCLLFDRAVDRLLAWLDYRRPFDDVRVGPGSPQDDEVPLVKLTPHCEYHKYSFPRDHRYWLDTYVFRFTPASPAFAAWRRTYLGALRKAAVLMGRRRLLLKSPATMANLEAVLALFPHAKFVHIKRDPHAVVPSQLHLHRTMARKYGLQAVTDAELTDFTFYQYRGYMAGFLADRHRVPAANLVEIRYEDLVADPQRWLAVVYDRLALGDFTARATALRDYLAAVADYTPHRFPEDRALTARIDAELGFACAALGYAPRYAPREPSAASEPASRPGGTPAVRAVAPADGSI